MNKKISSGRNLSLSDMKFKKGILKTPFNFAFDNMNFEKDSWHETQLPDYLWIATIVSKNNKRDSINKINLLVKYIKDNSIEVTGLKFTNFLDLKDSDLINVLNYLEGIGLRDYLEFCSVIGLSIDGFEKSRYKLIYDHFLLRKYKFHYLVEEFEKIFKEFGEYGNSNTTFVQSLVIEANILLGNIVIGNDSILNNMMYEYINSKDEIYISPILESAIRSAEVGIRQINKMNYFSVDFYNVTAEILKCNAKVLKKEDDFDMDEYDKFYKQQNDYIDENLHQHKNNSVNEIRYQVIIDTFRYCLNIFKETKNTGFNTVISRISFRTVLECYVNIKYMCCKEKEDDSIWEMFQGYGDSSLRKISGEYDKHSDDSERKPSQYDVRELQILSNERVGENYGDINLKYFNNVNIRDKFKEIGRDDLYQLYYEYGTIFSHGYWSSIRMSSTDLCDQPLHRNHAVVSEDDTVNLSGNFEDFRYIISIFYDFINEQYPIKEV